MSKKLPRCAACGRAFRPNHYNVHSQIYCTHPDCVRARKRERQRRSYNRRYRDDPDFREQECRRAAAGNRQRRAAAKAARDGPDAAAGAAPNLELQHLITGFVSHLAHSDDPAVVCELMSGYADRGRRLAAAPGERARTG